MTITVDSLLLRPKLDCDGGYDMAVKGASVVVHELLPVSRLTSHRFTEYHEAPFWVRESVPLFPIIGGPDWYVHADHLYSPLR